MRIASSVLFSAVIAIATVLAAVLISCGLVSAQATTTTFTAVPGSPSQLIYKVYQNDATCTTITSSTNFVVPGSNICLVDGAGSVYRSIGSTLLLQKYASNQVCSGSASSSTAYVNTCTADEFGGSYKYAYANNPSLQAATAFQRQKYSTGDCTGTSTFDTMIGAADTCIFETGKTWSTKWKNQGTYVLKGNYSGTSCNVLNTYEGWITNLCYMVSSSESFKYVYMAQTTTTAGPPATPAPISAAGCASTFSALVAAAIMSFLMA